LQGPQGESEDLSEYLLRTNIFNGNGDVQISGTILNDGVDSLVIGRKSLTNGDRNIVIGDGVGVYGHDVVAIMNMETSSGTSPSINIFNTNAIHLGNSNTSLVNFGINGLSMMWGTDYVKFQVGNNTGKVSLKEGG
jgi:hypothetical protein